MESKTGYMVQLIIVASVNRGNEVLNNDQLLDCWIADNCYLPPLSSHWCDPRETSTWHCTTNIRYVQFLLIWLQIQFLVFKIFQFQIQFLLFQIQFLLEIFLFQFQFWNWSGIELNWSIPIGNWRQPCLQPMEMFGGSMVLVNLAMRVSLMVNA